MDFQQKRSLVFKLLAYLKPYKTRLVLSVLALTTAAVTVILIGHGLRQLVDLGFGSQSLSPNGALFFLTLLAMIMGSTSFLRSYLSSWIASHLVNDVKADVFKVLLHRSPAFFDQAQVGDLMSRLDTDTQLIQIMVGRSASMGLRSVLQFVGAFFMLFLVSAELAGLTCIASFIALLPLLLFGKQIYALTHASQKYSAHASAYCLERLDALTTIQAYSKETSTQEQYKSLLQQALVIKNKQTISSSLISALVIILITLGASVILWFGGQEIVNDQLTSGSFIAFVFYAIIIAGSLGNASEAWKDVQRALAAAGRVFALMPEDDAKKPTVRALKVPLQGDIVFEKVTFAYPTRPEISALKDISFHIKHGDTVAFIGPSGSGKSSLFKILLGFYAPQKGRILLDHVPIGALDPRQYRPHIGWIPQNPALFSGTISENIKFASPHASFQKIEEAAHHANAIEFIRKLPDGFSTQIGEKGHQLSIGQKQRLVIARLFLQNPAILLLDEVTTGLDAENTRYIQEALEVLRQGRTTLMVTHNLSTILNFNRILVINQGQILASGNHTTLMRQNSLYRKFVALQFSDAPKEQPAKAVGNVG